MKYARLSTRSRKMLLLTSLVLVSAAAQAFKGYTVVHEQESMVRTGMSINEVQSAIGKPEHAVKYGNEPGPTWTYVVLGAQDTLFDVDFGADGKVIAFGERSDDSRVSGGDSN